jgi:hypothetical protein
MTTVLVEIRPRLATSDDEPEPIDNTPNDEEPAEFISDLDKYVEHTMCSCSASDDNPY